MFFLCVGSFGNEFGSRMSVSGIVQLKLNLTIEEAAAYSGIGVRKLYDMTGSEECPFVLWIGSRRLIKRKVFDEYIAKMYSV